MTDIEAYYTEHLSTPGAVLLVSIIGKPKVMAAFTDMDIMKEWIACQTEGNGILVNPCVVNVPEFGNIPFEESN